MTDYLLITPDGQLAEKTGYPGDVGCHGYSGQTLHPTKTGFGQDSRTLRIMACDCSLIMQDEHPENPVATTVIGALRYPIPFRGPVAIYAIGWDNEPIEMTASEIGRIQRLATIGQAAAEAGVRVTIVHSED